MVLVQGFRCRLATVVAAIFTAFVLIFVAVGMVGWITVVTRFRGRLVTFPVVFYAVVSVPFVDSVVSLVGAF